MIVKSKYARIFHSNCMTRRKYDELYEFAVLVRSHKNKVSQFVNDNLLRYLDYSKFQFVKEMRARYHGYISSSFDHQLYSDVYVNYQNKFSAVIKKLSFYVVDFKGFELYKKNTKKHKRGDLKRVLFKKRKTKLSACLTYLARYGNVNTLRYLEQQVLVCTDADKVKFPLTIRPIENGDWFIPFGMTGRKLVSDYLTDIKLSILQKRRQLVLVDASGSIVWVVGCRTDNRFKVSAETTKMLRISYKLD